MAGQLELSPKWARFGCVLYLYLNPWQWLDLFCVSFAKQARSGSWSSDPLSRLGQHFGVQKHETPLWGPHVDDLNRSSWISSTFMIYPRIVLQQESVPLWLSMTGHGHVVVLNRMVGRTHL